MSLLMSSILSPMVSFERGIWDNFTSVSFQHDIRHRQHSWLYECFTNGEWFALLCDQPMMASRACHHESYESDVFLDLRRTPETDSPNPWGSIEPRLRTTVSDTHSEGKSYSCLLLLVLCFSLIAGCEAKHGHHHRPPRNRRHHHDSDFFETGASQYSESERMDTMRRMHHSPQGHHHHAKGHHKQSAANLHQHFASEVQTYETKYESSYSYGDDYEDDIPEGLPSDGDKYGAYKPHSQQHGHTKSIYEPVPVDQDSMHNSQVSTKVVRPPNKQDDLIVSEPIGVKTKDDVNRATSKPARNLKVVTTGTEIHQKNLRPVTETKVLPVKSHTRKEVPIQKRVIIPNLIAETEEKKVQLLSLDNSTPIEFMMKDAPAARTQNLISQAEETAQESKSSSSSSTQNKGRVQANGLVKKHRPKALEASGGGRWTLTYQGGPSEAALNNSLTNVTAQIGGAAFLPCRVGHLGDRQISWIRSRDWHVLTSGNDLYTADPRFSVLHEPGTQDWTLHIKYATPRDNGTYECQVSTGTGIISLFVNLRVVTPEAHIPGRGQYHVNKGSPIILTCVISKSPTPPHYVFWYHNGELLNFLRDRPDFTITLEPKMPLVELIDGGIDDGLVPATDDGTGVASVSRLQMKLAEDRHSGNYTCAAPKTKPASTLVFVTEGDKTAAVQRIDSSSATAVSSPLTLILGLFAANAWLSLHAGFIEFIFYLRFPFQIRKKFCR
ncbi:Immunoglobulin I-set [Trinorchestia longiramus]|nr:Immunoglobulin I-set [Trinorchestia longiramus]